jgi:hypothetical protein
MLHKQYRYTSSTRRQLSELGFSFASEDDGGAHVQENTDIRTTMCLKRKMNHHESEMREEKKTMEQETRQERYERRCRMRDAKAETDPVSPSPSPSPSPLERNVDYMTLRKCSKTSSRDAVVTPSSSSSSSSSSMMYEEREKSAASTILVLRRSSRLCARKDKKMK